MLTRTIVILLLIAASYVARVPMVQIVNQHVYAV